MAKSQELRKDLAEKIHRRKPSLTACEEAFLHALLIDPPVPVPAPPVDPVSRPAKVEEEDAKEPAADDGQHGKDDDGVAALDGEFQHDQMMRGAARVLDDDMLFSVPPQLSLEEQQRQDEGRKEEETRRSRHSRRRAKRQSLQMPEKYKFLRGLWHAYEDGISPQKLVGLAKRESQQQIHTTSEEAQPLLDPEEAQHETYGAALSNDEDDDSSVKSDDEIRIDKSTVLSQSDDSSWDEEEGGLNHFDTWQVLKDEYAADFGFDYNPDGTMPTLDDSDVDQHRFSILGTSADDIGALPHVLSPPLMDSLLTFVPDNVSEENLWLKYSLIRDGASLTTLKRYVRASPNTIIAIETTTGHVFGSFTSSPWRTQPGLYGGNPAFVWKMRYNRNSPCHSLIEQAQLESEIDVHLLLGDHHRIQCSSHDTIGIGEGELAEYDDFGHLIETGKDESIGFAFCLSEDLLSGTTSQCRSFKNPCLTNPDSKGGEAFEVLNLEVWAFTPCMTVETAERLEMTHFFINESVRSVNSTCSSSRNLSSSQFSSASSNMFGSEDFDRGKFYRRVGHDDENEANRERWQYRNMMDGGGGGGGASRGIGASPRFTNA